MTELKKAARQALEAFGEIEWSNNSQWQSDRAKTAITALREALEAAPQPAAPTQDPAAWAITYDGRTPHTLWHEGDGPLLDLEIKRQGGSAQKMALYTTPQPTRQPLTDKQIQDIWCSAKNEGNQHGPFWFAHAIERAHGIGGEE